MTYKEYKKQVGVKLREARVKSGLSQVELGKKMGATFMTIHRCESGESSSLETIWEMCEILGVDIAEILKK